MARVLCEVHCCAVPSPRCVCTAQVGLLAASADELTWSLTSDEPGVRVSIPTYNVPRSVAGRLADAVRAKNSAHGRRLLEGSSPGDVTVDLPPLDDGLSPPPPPVVTQLEPTEVQVLQPDGLKGFWIAGQALFNPITPGACYPVVWACTRW